MIMDDKLHDDDRWNVLPSDWGNPEWGVEKKVHNWRNYVSDDVQKLWGTFNRTQQAAIAKMAQDIADNEDWD